MATVNTENGFAGHAGKALRWSMGLLFLVSFFNYMDRYMLAVLLPSIKEELSLSDAQLGIISGFAFTLFYATLGVPIARLADRFSRRNIISIALAVWSVMTAICGLAQSFIQLALARVLVGVGEAGATPPSHSLIADYYPVAKRGKGIAIYSLGAPVGILVGFIAGSWLAENYSWRIALYGVGIPGLLLAFMVWRFLFEAPRGASEQVSSTEKTQISLKEASAILLRSKSFVMFSVGTGLYTVVWLGAVQWLPSYFTRSFDMSLTQVGFWLALVLGFSQIFGMLASGWVTDSLVTRSVRFYALIPAIAIGISIPIFAAVFMTKNPWLGLALLFPTFMISVMQGPATFAGIQGLVPPSMRAMAAAVLLLITNLIGGGLGPPLVGLVSDRLTEQYGDEGLRLSLLVIACGFSALSAIVYFIGSFYVKKEFRSAT
ncbi:MAG: MFS transporter [Pseudomonadota bacterium]